MKQSGADASRRWRVIIAALLPVVSLVFGSCASGVKAFAAVTPTPRPTEIPKDEGSILVYVYDNVTRATVDGVVVRISNSSISDGADHRALLLPSCDAGQFLVVAAPNYETSFTACNGSNMYYIGLNPISGVDDVNYMWSSAYGNCDGCHRNPANGGYNEVEEWEKTAHAKVFVDPFFETMYRGINISGQSSAPGYRLDHSEDAGNCAYCHAPASILPSLGKTDLSSYYSRPAGANGEGVTCDVCHKVRNVSLDKNNYPALDRPGMLSLEFLRLSNSFVTGSFSNILLPLYNDGMKHSSTCSPVLSTSEFCAACHYGKFNDAVVYNSYGEWRGSWYGSNPADSTYKTCQDCHMSHMDVNNVDTPLSRRGACSETLDGYQNYDHNLLDVGAVTLRDGTEKIIPRMIQQAASLRVKLKYEPEKENSLKVHVEVENMSAGHKFPTDSPLRHLILVVTAKDQFGAPLDEVKGSKIPDWAGEQGINLGGVEGYAGQAGTYFANLLGKDSGDPSATAAYWNIAQNNLGTDNRLAPRDPQGSNYFFAIPDFGDIHITVKLIYRYAFFDLMNQKGWARPDVVVAVADCSVSLEKANELNCPEVQP